jgi:hypothetical protein
VRQSTALGWLVPLLAALLLVAVTYAQWRLKWLHK